MVSEKEQVSNETEVEEEEEVVEEVRNVQSGEAAETSKGIRREAGELISPEITWRDGGGGVRENTQLYLTITMHAHDSQFTHSVFRLISGRNSPAGSTASWL